MEFENATNIEIGNNCAGLKFYAANTITVGEDCSDIEFGFGCNNIIINDDSKYLLFRGNSKNMELPIAAQYNVFGYDINYSTMQDMTSATHLIADYECEIKRVADNDYKLFYYDLTYNQINDDVDA